MIGKINFAPRNKKSSSKLCSPFLEEPADAEFVHLKVVGSSTVGQFAQDPTAEDSRLEAVTFRGEQ